MADYILRIVQGPEKAQDVWLSRFIGVRAEHGARYLVLENASQQLASGVTVSQQADSLLVYLDGRKVAIIKGFYAPGMLAEFELPTVASPEPYPVMSAQTELDSVQAAVDDEELASAVAQPEVINQPLPDMPAASAESVEAGISSETTTVVDAPVAEVGARGWPAMPEMGMDDMSPLLLGGAGLLALAGLAAGGGGGDDGEDSPAATVSATVNGQVSAGPVLAEHDLAVQIRNAAGEVIATPGLDEDGSFSAVIENYQGVISVRVRSTDDENSDYRDEYTGTARNLGADLYAAAAVTDGSILNLNITPVTTLAYRQAIADGTPSSDKVNTTNAAIAELFGLSDLHNTEISTTISGGAFDASDDLSEPEKYGAILASISGLDNLNNGDSATSLDTLNAEITVSDSQATAGDGFQTLLNNGAVEYHTNLANSFSKPFIMIRTPGQAEVRQDVADNSVVYQPQTLGGGSVSYLLGGEDADKFGIDAVSGEVSLNGAPDIAQSPYRFTVSAEDGNGNFHTLAVSLSVTPVDTTAPVFTSGDSVSIDENSGADQVVYQAQANDENTVLYSLLDGGDAAAFSMNSTNGQLILNENPDFEQQASYGFSVRATDSEGNYSEQAVTLSINDVFEDITAPVVTSGATATAIDENSGAGQMIYQTTASDESTLSYALAATDDGAAFQINTVNGQVILVADPDFEQQSSYNFSVVVTDSAGNRAQQDVGLTINDVDEIAPLFSSGDTAAAIDENSGANQLIYTAAASDSGGVNYSLADSDDGAVFSIDSSSGEVRLTTNPNFEQQASYRFTVLATDARGNAAQQSVALAINDVAETDVIPPEITSGTTATALDEGSGANQPVYQASATDASTISYSLAADGDAARFSIDAASGMVTLLDNPDFETKASYSFSVVATDSSNNSSQQSVSLSINDVDETDSTPPAFSSGTTAEAINEATGANQVIYQAVASDESTVTYSLADSQDGASFSINSSNGQVTLLPDPDFETQSSYSFSVVATDSSNNRSQQTVSLEINDVIETDSTPPAFSSGTTAEAINESTGANQVIYQAVASDESTVIYSLADSQDGASFSINSSNGQVTLLLDPDFETQSSYSFSVVATDSSNNSAQQTVSLAINDVVEVDTTPPVITSAATAAAITEGSGASQLVYRVTADDASVVSYSLVAGGDSDKFSIDSTSGNVTLTEDPDTAQQTSYSFSVLATDAAGNVSEAYSVTLPVLAAGGPTVDAIALTDANGARNNYLNQDDVLRAAVTMSAATSVTGEPGLLLKIGGSDVVASYESGSGSAELVFAYTIVNGENDADGISIDANSLVANGATITDASLRAATLEHDAVAANANYLVDTSAPQPAFVNPGSVLANSSVLVNSNEAATIYMVNDQNNIGELANILSAADDQWNQVEVSSTALPAVMSLSGLVTGRYDLYAVDQAGNFGISSPLQATTISDSLNPAIVVFDMINGNSSAHSNRQFDTDTSYNIYLQIASSQPDLRTDGDFWGAWSGAANLGADDKLILVGEEATVVGNLEAIVNQFDNVAPTIAWKSATAAQATAVAVTQGGKLTRFLSNNSVNIDLWSGNWSNPNAGQSLDAVYLLSMPADVMSTQGLA